MLHPAIIAAIFGAVSAGCLLINTCIAIRESEIQEENQLEYLLNNRHKTD